MKPTLLEFIEYYGNARWVTGHHVDDRATPYCEKGITGAQTALNHITTIIAAQQAVLDEARMLLAAGRPGEVDLDRLADAFVKLDKL